MASPDPDRARFHPSRLPLVALALVIGPGLAMYTGYTQTTVDGWDPVAYLYAGQRIAEGHGPTICHPYNEAIGPYFTLAGFNVQVSRGPCLYLNYPPGFPLLLAAAQVLTGLPDTALYVPAFLGALGLLVTFALGAALFDRWVGLVGAAVLALTPVYLDASTSPWSDLAGTVFVMGGLALHLLGQSSLAEHKSRPAIAAACGSGLILYGLFIRYTNAIVLLPLALYILVSQKKDAFKHISHWLFSGLTVLGFVGILLFNHMYFGGYLTTGYSPRHGWYTWPAFSLRYAWGPSPVGGESLKAAFETVRQNLGWLLLPGLVGMVTMPPRKKLLLGGLILSFVLLYGLYAFPARGVNARFLLPVFPPLALVVAYGLRYGVQRWGWADRRGWLSALAGGALLLLVLGLPLPRHLRDLQERNERSSQVVMTVQALVEHSEPDTVFLAYSLNDPIFFYGKRLTLFYRRLPPLDPTSGDYRWDKFESLLIEAVTNLLERGVPVYYVQDSSPPFADSLNILMRQFVLEPQQTTPITYRVSLDQ